MEEEYFEKSKSQKKREVIELQKLGEKLIDLSIDQLKRIDIDKELIEAVIEAKGMKPDNSRKRQHQYIGVLMRKIDTEPIERALHLIDNGISISKKEAGEVEQWHSSLIDGTMDENLIIEKLKHADRQKIRQLLRNTKKEMEKGKKSKSSKNLLKYLKELYDVEYKN